MNEIKSTQVPEAVRDFSEKGLDQARGVFESFIDTAEKALDAMPLQPLAAPVKDLIRSTLGFTEKNMKAAFDHAQRMVHAKDMQEAVQIQTEFLQSQFTAVQEQMKKLGGGT